MNFLKGYKTFITFGLFAALAVASLVLKVEVPEGVFAVLAALGFASFRAGVTKISGNSGVKTYAAVLATIGLEGARLFGLNLSPEIVTTIYGVLASLGVVGVRDALKDIREL